MKNIVKSLLIVVAVAAIAGGATWAYFSDTAAITGSTFSAGTLDLRIDSNPDPIETAWSNGFSAPANFVTNLYPGYPAKEEHNWQVLDILNNGTVDGYATIKFDATDWSTSAMGDDLNFTVYYDGTDNSTFGSPIAAGSLNAWNHNTYQLGQLGAGKIGQVKIVWDVPTSAGNEIQGAWVVLNTTFGLNQVVNQVN